MTNLVDQITVLVLTYNEEPNIARTLDAVKWAKRILVIDSGSTDRTIDIVRQYAQAEIATRAFDSHQLQWNYGLSLCADLEWVLALDADYCISAELSAEISALVPPSEVSGYCARFRYSVFGHTLRASAYPDQIVLFRPARAHYIQEGHTQRLIIDGPVHRLRGCVNHDDRKSLSRWLTSQMRYAQLEANYLLTKPPKAHRRIDRLRLMRWPMPLLVLPYILVMKGGVLDGWPGWYYAMQRMLAELLIALELTYARLRDDTGATKTI